MTAEEEREVIRVCGPDYEESDIPPVLRRNDIEVRESVIPICQPRDNYTVAAVDHQEKLSE